MNRIRIFLAPIMSRATRDAINRIERNPTSPEVSYRFLVIVRSAMDIRLAQTIRIRQGLMMLLQILPITIQDLLKVLKNHGMLLRYGILRSSDNPALVIRAFTTYLDSIKSGIIGQKNQKMIDSVADGIAKESDDRMARYMRQRWLDKLSAIA